MAAALSLLASLPVLSFVTACDPVCNGYDLILDSPYMASIRLVGTLASLSTKEYLVFTRKPH